MLIYPVEVSYQCIVRATASVQTPEVMLVDKVVNQVVPKKHHSFSSFSVWAKFASVSTLCIDMLTELTSSGKLVVSSSGVSV